MIRGVEILMRRVNTQGGLSAVCHLFDRVFDAPYPVSMWRVGLLFELARADQLVLLAEDEQVPVGAAVALRGRSHVALCHLAVDPDHHRNGIGYGLFQQVIDWTHQENLDEIRWCVDPRNITAISAYLRWGARMTGWLDDAYGVDSDPCNTGRTPKLVGGWRSILWPGSRSSRLIGITDYDQLRSVMMNGGQITARHNDLYTVVTPEVVTE